MRPVRRMAPEARTKLDNAIKTFGSRRSLAEQLGLSEKTLDRAINGLTDPGFSLVAAICTATGLSLDELAYAPSRRVAELSSAFIAVAGVLARASISADERQRVDGHFAVIEQHLRVMQGGVPAREMPDTIGPRQSLTALLRYAEGDWHPERIKAAVRESGSSFTKLAAANNMSVAAFTHALHRPILGPETVISEFLNLSPHTIWPSRYHPDGTRKSLRPRSEPRA